MTMIWPRSWRMPGNVRVIQEVALRPEAARQEKGIEGDFVGVVPQRLHLRVLFPHDFLRAVRVQEVPKAIHADDLHAPEDAVHPVRKHVESGVHELQQVSGERRVHCDTIGDPVHGGFGVFRELDELQNDFREVGQGIHVPRDGLREHADLFQVDVVHRDEDGGNCHSVPRVYGECLLPQAEPAEKLQEDKDPQPCAFQGIKGRSQGLHE